MTSTIIACNPWGIQVQIIRVITEPQHSLHRLHSHDDEPLEDHLARLPSHGDPLGAKLGHRCRLARHLVRYFEIQNSTANSYVTVGLAPAEVELVPAQHRPLEIELGHPGPTHRRATCHRTRTNPLARHLASYYETVWATVCGLRAASQIQAAHRPAEADLVPAPHHPPEIELESHGTRHPEIDVRALMSHDSCLSMTAVWQCSQCCI